MPTYIYTCSRCGHEQSERRAVDLRNASDPCPACVIGFMWRRFTPTANIVTPEHFRHNQADFLPEKGDPKWADMVHVSEARERKPPDVSAGFKKHLLENELLKNG